MTRREVSASAFDYLCVEMVNDALDRAWTRRARDDVEASARADDVHVRADVRDDATVAAACETLARTGERIGERCAERATRGMDPFADEQSAIMCACKVLDADARERADALKTNNKGTFVFHDDSFRAMRGVVGGARGRGTSGTTGERLASDASASSSAAARRPRTPPPSTTIPPFAPTSPFTPASSEAVFERSACARAFEANSERRPRLRRRRRRAVGARGPPASRSPWTSFERPTRATKRTRSAAHSRRARSGEMDRQTTDNRRRRARAGALKNIFSG